MIAEGKTERRLVLADERGEIRLIIFLELVFVRNVTTVAVHFPTFREIAQRNPRIVLNDDATVLHEKIAHTGEPIPVHEEGSGFEQAESGPARGTPAQKGAVASGQIRFEIIKRLRLFTATERNLYAFCRGAHVCHIDYGVTETRQKNVQNRQCSTDIPATEISTHFFGNKILKSQNRVHGITQRN